MSALGKELEIVVEAEQDLVKVVRSLHQWGCCPRCILRFLHEKQCYVYYRPLEDLTSWVQSLLSDPAAAEDAKAETGASDGIGTEAASENDRKSTADDAETEMTNPADAAVTAPGDGNSEVCVACLGILQEKFCSEEFCTMVHAALREEDFQFDTFYCSLMTPVTVILRQHSLHLKLRELLPSAFTEDSRENITPLKDIWKWVNGRRLSEAFGVPFSQRSPFEVLLSFSHPSVDQECSFLLGLHGDIFYRRKKNKNAQELYTRANIHKAISLTADYKFRQAYYCPPKKTQLMCQCEQIAGLHEQLFLAGRYNKYSRHLSQTPWFIDGKRKTETSIEELICNKLMDAIRGKEFRFMSSGREDVDVKMLGTGRPFLIEFVNPHRTKFTAEELKVLQTSINGDTEDIAVRDLQIVTREDSAILKDGEQEKQKSYSAKCWTEKPVTQHQLDVLNDIKDLTLNQNTPIRVLHRRNLSMRERTVHSLRVEPLDSHHFTMHLSTQAGTYIKEFVHGDFGRTTPNLRTILDMDCDILELNVESVDLDWPKSLDP